MSRKLRGFSGKKLEWGTAEFKHDTAVKETECIVLVPVYKRVPTKVERASFLRLVSVLGKNYEIALLHGKSLNVSEYRIDGVQLSEVVCNDAFFSSRAYYSDMMEFSEFYSLFSGYKYILLYQLDAWIFEDRVKYFTKLDYDFIGSVHGYSGGKGNCVGNGGFSLRKVSSFIKICKEEENTPIPSNYPEDLAFSVTFSKKLKIAPLNIGLQFGFQNAPDKLYVKNENKLPMGCHAFEKCNFNWWKEFINIDETIKFGIYSKDAALFRRAEEWTRGKGVNLTTPTTIGDKLGWLKIYDCSPVKTLCADKIKVHEYCRKKLGEDICVPILKVYDKPEDINFNELPKQFVLKCNHGSGYNIIVKDKSRENKTSIVSKLNSWLKKDYALDYWYEMHYHYIDKKCFAEHYLGDGVNDVPDYKILCCNGEPIMIQVISDRFHPDRKHANIYTPDWKKWDIGWHTYKSDYSRPDKKPENLDKMLSYARKLSEDFKFVRVDFYALEGKLYLGELTFAPDAGFMRCRDRKTEIEIGNMLNIHSTKKKRGVVYTCITGGYETLEPLSNVSPEFDYVCFSDRDITCDSWKVEKIPEKLKNLDNKRINRYIKTHPHEFFPNYDMSVYIDGNVDIKKDLGDFIDKNCPHEKGVLFAGQHPNRKCIYKEAEAIVKLKKDTADNVNPQIQKYAKEGFPKDYGLTQNCILIRYHNDEKCKRLMETWWNEIATESYRDQLSLFYSLWKNKDVRYCVLDKSLFSGPVFVWARGHKRVRNTANVNKNTSTSENITASTVTSLMDGSLSLSKESAPRPKYKPMVKKSVGHPRTKSMKKILSIF